MAKIIRSLDRAQSLDSVRRSLRGLRAAVRSLERLEAYLEQVPDELEGLTPGPLGETLPSAVTRTEGEGELQMQIPIFDPITGQVVGLASTS